MPRLFLCTIFVLLFTGSITAQNCSLKQLNYSHLKAEAQPSDTALQYPVVTFLGDAVSKKVNKAIQAEFYTYFSLDTALSLDSAIAAQVATGLTDMSAVILYCSSKFLTLRIHYEAMAAYPVSWDRYCNFDSAGNILSLDKMIRPSEMKRFKQLLKQKQAISINAYRKEIKAALVKKEMDATDYRTCLDIVKSNCMDNYDPSQFEISPGGIKVIMSCGFPHVLLAFDWTDAFVRFSKKELFNILKPAYKL